MTILERNKKMREEYRAHARSRRGASILEYDYARYWNKLEKRIIDWMNNSNNQGPEMYDRINGYMKAYLDGFSHGTVRTDREYIDEENKMLLEGHDQHFSFLILSSRIERDCEFLVQGLNILIDGNEKYCDSEYYNKERHKGLIGTYSYYLTEIISELRKSLDNSQFEKEYADAIYYKFIMRMRDFHKNRGVIEHWDAIYQELPDIAPTDDNIVIQELVNVNPYVKITKKELEALLASKE